MSRVGQWESAGRRADSPRSERGARDEDGPMCPAAERGRCPPSHGAFAADRKKMGVPGNGEAYCVAVCAGANRGNSSLRPLPVGELWAPLRSGTADGLRRPADPPHASRIITSVHRTGPPPEDRGCGRSATRSA